jgi:hypothetical protein
LLGSPPSILRIDPASGIHLGAGIARILFFNQNLTQLSPVVPELQIEKPRKTMFSGAFQNPFVALGG